MTTRCIERKTLFAVVSTEATHLSTVGSKNIKNQESSRVLFVWYTFQRAKEIEVAYAGKLRRLQHALRVCKAVTTRLTYGTGTCRTWYL